MIGFPGVATFGSLSRADAISLDATAGRKVLEAAPEEAGTYDWGGAIGEAETPAPSSSADNEFPHHPMGRSPSRHVWKNSTHFKLLWFLTLPPQRLCWANPFLRSLNVSLLHNSLATWPLPDLNPASIWLQPGCEYHHTATNINKYKQRSTNTYEYKHVRKNLNVHKPIPRLVTKSTIINKDQQINTNINKY